MTSNPKAPRFAKSAPRDLVEGVNEMRLQKSDIPNTPHQCINRRCVYNEDSVCDEPRINNGNSDAKCHKRSNKVTLSWLEKPNAQP